MSEIQVANLWFESSKSTGIVGGVSTNTYTIRAGGVDQLVINSTASVINNVSVGTFVNSIAVGANVVINTSTVFVGNSTVNTVANSSTLSINGNNISPFIFRNKIINGAMVIDQRNSGANTSLSTNNSVYTVDRWWGQVAANTTGCVAYRTTDVPSGFVNSFRVQRTSGNTGTSAITVGQIVESYNCYDLQGQTVTLSFWAKCGANFSATSNNISVVVATGTTADEGMAKFANSTWTGYSAVINQTQQITSTWSKYTITSSTLGSSISELGISFKFTPTGTASTNDWFEITGVQLEAGTVATPYEARPVSTELALCQRYYQTGGNFAYNVSTYISLTYPVTMRATPTLSFSVSPSGGSSSATYGFYAIHNQVTSFTYTASIEL